MAVKFLDNNYWLSYNITTIITCIYGGTIMEDIVKCECETANFLSNTIIREENFIEKCGTGIVHV